MVGPIRCHVRSIGTLGHHEHLARFYREVDLDGVEQELGNYRDPTREEAIRGAIASVRARRHLHEGARRNQEAFRRGVGQQASPVAQQFMEGVLSGGKTPDAATLVGFLPSTEEKLIAIVERELELAHALVKELREENKALQVRLESAWDDLTEARDMNCEPTPLSTNPYNLKDGEINTLFREVQHMGEHLKPSEAAQKVLDKVNRTMRVSYPKSASSQQRESLDDAAEPKPPIPYGLAPQDVSVLIDGARRLLAPNFRPFTTNKADLETVTMLRHILKKVDRRYA